MPLSALALPRPAVSDGRGEPHLCFGFPPALPPLGVMLPGAGWGLEKPEEVEPRGTGGLLRLLQGSGPHEECASEMMPPLVRCCSCYLEGLAVWFNRWA